MRVLIAVDIEGISGIANSLEYDEFSYGRDWITADTNSAIQGAFDGGADHITVTDTHGSHNDNILFDKLHSKARLIRGGKNTPLYFLEGLTKDTDLVMLIGWHDKIAGTGVLAHSMLHLEVKSMHINGIEVGEVEIAGILAGVHSVPIGLVTGDDITCSSAVSFFGDVETACVKKAINRFSADCLPLEEARHLIENKAKRAAERAKEFKPFLLEKPYVLEWDCNDYNIATMVARVPGTELLDDNRVRYANVDFIEVFNMLMTWRFLIKVAIQGPN